MLSSLQEVVKTDGNIINIKILVWVYSNTRFTSYILYVFYYNEG